MAAQDISVADCSETGFAPARFRWTVAALLLGAAVLNYLDRQTLSILAPTIQQRLHLSDAGYGQIVTLFLVAYTLALLVSGPLVDRIGARLGMAVFVSWWSLSNIATMFVGGAQSLAGCRFSLGLGEAGNWPASTKVVSDLFPARERAAAIGLYTMGATAGATLAPLLILALCDRFGWRGAFVATGLAGLAWAAVWLLVFRPAINIGSAPTPLRRAAGPAHASLAITLRRPDVWVLMLGRLLTDPVWYFFQFWFAKYLFTIDKVSQSNLRITWVIYLAADVGSVAGGIASGWLVRGGSRPATARMGIMALCAVVMPLSLAIARGASLDWTLAIASVLVFSHLAWLSNISALVVDVIPAELVGTCFGIVAAGSAVGGILMNRLIVTLIEHQAYSQWFAVTALVHPLAWIILWLGIGRSPRGEGPG